MVSGAAPPSGMFAGMKPILDLKPLVSVA